MDPRLILAIVCLAAFIILLWAFLACICGARADDTPDEINRAIGIGGAADREGR